MITFHLMDFETATTYTLEFEQGEIHGNSWRVRDENGVEDESITSFTLASNKLSEVHDIVLNRESGKGSILTIVAVKYDKYYNG